MNMRDANYFGRDDRTRAYVISQPVARSGQVILEQLLSQAEYNSILHQLQRKARRWNMTWQFLFVLLSHNAPPPET